MDTLQLRGFDSFNIGEVVYYVKPSTYTIRRSRVSKMQMRRLRGLPLIETCDKVVMDNGDIISNRNVFLSKQEALQNLTDDVISSINYEKKALARSQQRINELERVLKVLQKHQS